MALLKNKTTLLKGVLLFFFIAKVFLDFFVVLNRSESGTGLRIPFFAKQQSDYIVQDDAEMAREALFLLKGRGFVIDSYFDRPQFAKVLLHKTALRPKALVLAHALGVLVYCKMLSIDEKKIEEVPKGYFQAYAWWICLLKELFLAMALWSFYKVCTLYFNNRQSLLATLLFLLFPSVYFFVGTTNMVDTLVMPLEVLFFCWALSCWKSSRRISISSLFGYSLLLLVLCYLKPHHLLLLVLLDLVLLGFFIWERTGKELPLLLWLNGTVFLGIVPVLISNYLDFKEVFISTQSGFNLFHGHNLAARGSWSPSIWKSHHDQLFSLITSNSQLPFLNEKQEADYYGQLAWQWIFQHPGQELWLMARKVGMFFLPHNFMNWKWNGYNLLVYSGCILFSIQFAWNGKREDKALLFFFVPIVGISMLNVLYFVEYRWRYYAEPFMVFFAFSFAIQLKNRWMKK